MPDRGKSIAVLEDYRRRFALVRFGEIKADRRRTYIVKDLIPRGGLIVVWGPPKCGKSFWVSDLALHVALDWPYRGRRIEAGAVVYVTCEGQSGFPARIEAFRCHKLTEGACDPPFYLLPTRLDLVADVEMLVGDIKAQLGRDAPVLIVIDTLNRSLAGSESKDEDMSAYVQACDRIREAFECAVLVVHHCGVEANRPRGHTSLTGAVDAQIAVERDKDENIVALVEFMKDGPKGDRIAQYDPFPGRPACCPPASLAGLLQEGRISCRGQRGNLQEGVAARPRQPPEWRICKDLRRLRVAR